VVHAIGRCALEKTELQLESTGRSFDASSDLDDLAAFMEAAQVAGTRGGRQKFLLESQKALAGKMAREIDPKAWHLVVSQTLLPHLCKAGVLGGRTFDVLVNRWPMKELQRRLDEAAARHPESVTLVDFRADEDLVHAESEALAASARIVTPHRAIAAYFGANTILLDWKYPEVKTHAVKSGKQWFFPASLADRNRSGGCGGVEENDPNGINSDSEGYISNHGVGSAWVAQCRLALMPSSSKRLVKREVTFFGQLQSELR
jgi:hypothetical protein